jgi:flagellar basal body-associated protein FliL
MGRVGVRPTGSTGGGVWTMLLVALIVIVLAASAAYYLFGAGVPNYSPTAPNATNVPASGAPATAAPTAPGYP